MNRIRRARRMDSATWARSGGPSGYVIELIVPD